MTILGYYCATFLITIIGMFLKKPYKYPCRMLENFVISVLFCIIIWPIASATIIEYLIPKLIRKQND